MDADRGSQIAGRLSVLRAVALGALLVALGYFAWRGVWRGLAESQDLVVGYSAARAWLAGLDPSHVATLKQQLFEGGGGELATGALLDTFRNVYFPTTLPAYVPLGVMPWAAAKSVALVINVGMILGIVVGLVHLLGWRRTEPRAHFLAAFVLALAPVHRTISSGSQDFINDFLLLNPVFKTLSPHHAGQKTCTL